MAAFGISNTLVAVLVSLSAVVPSCTGNTGAPWLLPSPDGLRSSLDQLCGKALQVLESVVGSDAIHTSGEYFKVAVRFLSEGAASGLNVIAVYVTEILSATGITVGLPFPHFTAEGVASVAQWALLALIGYWVLSLVLRLALTLLRRVLWLLKLGVVLWLFVVIVTDANANTDTTVWRLGALVCACVLLGLGRARCEENKSGHLEKRLRCLEGRMKEMERSQKE